MAKRNPEKSRSEAGVPSPPKPLPTSAEGGGSSPGNSSLSSNRQTTLICLGLFVVVMAVFLPALSNSFVNFDDDVYVHDNLRVQRGLTWENIRWAFTTLEAGFWHPFTWCSLFLDKQIFGLSSLGFHLTNLVLHALNTVLLFLLFRRMTGAVWRSAFVAALFALHPLHVEPVVWVASRKDVLSTLFWMLSLLMYVRYAQGRKPAGKGASPFVFYILSFFFFACGLMSKTMVVTLPVILLLLDWWPLRRLTLSPGRQARTMIWSLLLEKIPFLAAAFGCGLLTMHAEKKVGAMEAVSSIPLEYRMANATFGYGRYLVQMVWPEGMAPFYPYPKTFSLLSVLGAGFLILVTTGAALGMARKRPYLAFGWLWYVVVLLPVCGLIQVGSHSRADRYTYLPFIGIFVILAWGAWELTRRWPRQTVALSVGAAAALLCCALVTRVQIGYWKDSEALFRHTLEVTSDNHFAHNNLGLALLQKGQVEAAMAQFQEAVKIDPGYAKPHNNLGIALLEQGKMDEAVAQFREALKHKADLAEVSYNLGVAWLRKGQWPDAVDQFQKTLEIEPDHPKARYGLGSALLRAGRTSEAVVQFQEVLKLDPDYAEAHHDLGLAFLRLERADEAATQFQAALKIRPESAESCYNLALVLTKKGRWPDAIVQLQNALKIQPNFIEASEELGRAYLRTGKVDEAVAQFQKVVQASPHRAGSQSDLAGALLLQGRVGDALAHYQAASEAEPANPVLLNNMAWILATCPDATVRNGSRALEFARRADELSGGNSSSILGTLAAACAESGKYPEAVSNAHRALEIATAQGKQAEMDALKAQIELYRAGSPYRDSGKITP